jgi:hypothetical protein
MLTLLEMSFANKAQETERRLLRENKVGEAMKALMFLTGNLTPRASKRE